MVANGLWRIDFLGRDPGMWAVHSPWRSPTFYVRLPQLIGEIEAGQVADGQRGGAFAPAGAAPLRTVRRS